MAIQLAFSLCTSFAAAAPPENDRFENAREIEGTAGREVSSNVEATREAGEPIHANVEGGSSVWWRWVAPGNGIAEIDTFGSKIDTILSVYTGTTIRQLSLIATNDDAESFQSRVLFSAMEGTTYYIAVDGYFGEEGSIVLNWNLSEPVLCRDPPR
ncbi:MAG TPA: hypothetical protein VK116_00070, partial [Planctomycetota bacterium]|nr:hypothetical protein [Planctomycetota bacterium]